MQQESEPPAPGSGQAPTQFVTLAAEEIAISHRRIDGDRVRLSTSTRMREQQVDEELTHERVIVERVAVGRAIDAVPQIRFEGDVTIVPVVTEEIVIQRRLVLIEEVHLRRVKVAGRHRETVSLREQVAIVTRIAAPDDNGAGIREADAPEPSTRE